MKGSVRITLLGVFAAALMVLSPCSTPAAHAGPVAAEINLNSSTVQVVHNSPANTDVLNLNLNVENSGDSGSCDGGDDDLLETGVFVEVSRFSCIGFYLTCLGITGCPAPDFSADITYVEHDIGSASYGTAFAPNASGFVSSKIVALATPVNTCGTWSINLQPTGQNLSSITGPKVALILTDEDEDAGPLLGSACFDVNVNVGNGIVKPHQGVHRARH
jgi:hypothetical protein